MSENSVSKDAVVIERTFNAPVDLVWQMWTKPEHFKSWYGPQGFSVPVAELDVRVGGKRLVCMEMQTPDRSMRMWTTGEHTAVITNQRLGYTESPADENGNVVSPSAMGMPEGYPTTTEVTVLLEDLDRGTKMVLTHAGIPADSPGASGWNQAFDKLAERIATALES
jgi:uncharacterized protein YndB with AHSA1/START domain